MSAEWAPPDGLVAVVKRECPTCELVAPVLRQLADGGAALAVYSQDDPTFPGDVETHDDRDLEVSYRLRVETVPTLARVVGGRVVDRTEGWERAAWERVATRAGLGVSLPPFRPGCGFRRRSA